MENNDEIDVVVEQFGGWYLIFHQDMYVPGHIMQLWEIVIIYNIWWDIGYVGYMINAGIRSLSVERRGLELHDNVHEQFFGDRLVDA